MYNAYGDQLALPAGSALTFTLDGPPDPASVIALATEAPLIPTPATAARGSEGVIPSTILGPLALIAAFALAAVVIGYALRTRTKSPEARIIEIAKQIGRIDAAHTAGTLNHDLWHRQRAALKAEQMALRGYPPEKTGTGDE
jgi:hypothetical protein